MPARPHVLVIGDAMIDEYLIGSVTRQSPEEPKAPVVAIEERSQALGGAANVARNVVRLGGKATLVSVCGDDEAGRLMRKILKQEGISVFMVQQKSRPTTIKTRVYDGDRQLVRVDAESTAPLPLAGTTALAKFVAQRNPDMVIISDYAKGVISEKLVRAIIKIVGGENVIADIKPVNARLVGGIRAITPNRAEAVKMIGADVRDDTELAKVLADIIGTSAIVTLGAKGAAVFDNVKNEKFLVAPHRVTEHDVTGAGDTLTAALALRLALGKSLAEAVSYANVAAALAVTQRGTAAPTAREVAAALRAK